VTARKSIVIAGSLAQKPGRGGHTWVFLQYVLGFKKLGWDVLFLDRLEPSMCVSETGAAAPLESSWNVTYFLDVMNRFGLDRSYSLLCNEGTSTIGLSRAEILARVSASSALINVMGFLKDEEILDAAPMRVFLDIDPGFGQMWQALGQHETFRGHDAYVTIAENMGRPDCGIPTCGLAWITTKQPIVLDEWTAVDSVPGAPITSIASWRGAYGPVTHEGTTYGLRVHEFRKFAPLPRATASRFEMALDIHPADVTDIDLLTGHGWSLVEPREAAGDPWRYRKYISRSAAELMIAKSMYVQTRSGWFSDRSICYLASGRPVLAQDTGLRGVLPIGEGLLTFTTLEEAAECSREILRDHPRHARAARHLAEECFDSSKVLGALTRTLNLS
jgi:hypothetical protein